MERISLCGTWWYAAGDAAGDAAGAAQYVEVPHDGIIGGKVREDAPLDMAQGFFDRRCTMRYRKTFRLDEKQEGKCYALDFDGAFENAEVYLNGVYCGGQHYGYSPFCLDVTEQVRSGGNEIEVRLDNTPEPADRWYSGGGLYRPVWLLIREKEYPGDVQVITCLKEDGAEVRVTDGTQREAHACLVDAQGRTAAQAHGRGTLTLHVSEPKLWSASDPYLYTLVFGLDGGDAWEARVGIRSIAMTADGLFVNGRPETFRGVCVHQDLGCQGIAWDCVAWKERLLQLKDWGINALRLSHHAHCREMLELCDELGFYVYAECFDKWHSGLYGRYFDENWEQDVDAMVLRDRNHPCIVIWGVGNEVENQGLPSMVRTLAALTARVRSLDPTRPVTYAMNPHFKKAGKPIDFSKVKDIQKLVDEADEREIEDMQERLDAVERIAEHVDVVSCNYQEQWFGAIHARIPDKPILATEAYPFFMGHPDSMQNYTMVPPALFSQALPYVLGSFIWAGYDYLGESMGWPSKGWTGSLFRMDGAPRIAAWILRSQWRDEPLVHIGILDQALGDELTKAHWACPPFEDVWDFPGLHQGVVPYLIASNCERVEIHLGNRVFYPRKDPDQVYYTGFLPWMPGRLQVLGFRGGQCVAEHSLYTPGPAAGVHITDAGTGEWGPGQTRRFLVQFEDAQGHPCIRENRKVVLALSGAAKLEAVDSADLMDTTPYSSPERRAWHGRIYAVVRRTGTGAVELTARTQGFPDAQCMFPAGKDKESAK